MARTLSFGELVKLHNTVMLVANDYWRDTYRDEIAIVWGVVFGFVEHLTPKGWEIIMPLYDDVMKCTPMALENPGNLPVLS